MAAPRSYHVHELGCKVNQWEGQWFAEGLRALGLGEALPGEGADLYLVNSCSVTESGGAKSRHAVRHYLRRHPETKVIVTGCYAESDREVVEALPGVVKVFGNDAKAEIVPWVARSLLGMDAELPELPRGISKFSGHTRAFVKIQDGCRDRCSFCIIPSLRSTITSRSQEDVLSEIRRLVAHGHKEVVLTGVHIGYYGWERQQKDAVYRLLEASSQISGLKRIKLSSIEVHEIDEQLVDLFAAHEIFVPHFHLPLQAGCNQTLRDMRRKYSVERFRDATAMLREKLDDPAITTDLIVGFPGESPEHFDETMAFCEEMAFAKMHVFPFSVRQGTHAETMTNHIHDAEISRRKKVAAGLDDAMADAFRRRFLGCVVPVLVEERRLGGENRLTGLSDRFLRVDFVGEAALMNQIVPVCLEDIDGDRVQGRLAGKADPISS